MRHGATVGDLDKDTLFYLRARGIPADEARRMLIEAFVAEAIDGRGPRSARHLLAIRRWLEGGVSP